MYEARNDVGQTFGSKRAERFFNGLFGNLPPDFPTVDVTLIPEEGSVDKILSMPKLRHLKIVVTRPNSEDLKDDFDRVYRKMQNQNASTSTYEISKAPKVDRLTPDEDTRILAHVAAVNGYVAGKGRDETDSTKEHPKQIPLKVGADGVSIPQFVASIGKFLTKPVQRNK